MLRSPRLEVSTPADLLKKNGTNVQKPLRHKAFMRKPPPASGSRFIHGILGKRCGKTKYRFILTLCPV